MVISTSAFAATGTYFYDETGNSISANDGSNSRLTVLSSDDGCAVSSATSSQVAFSCNGGCGANYPTKVNILPNGSYFESGGGVAATTVYICTAAGRWVECAQNSNSTMPELKNSLTLRRYDFDGIGYRTLDFQYGRTTFISTQGVKDFCRSPYEYIYGGCTSGIFLSGDCREIALATTESQGGYTQYFYSVCAPGYYLKNHGNSGGERGKQCTRCSTIPNGTTNTTSWNSASECTVSCDSGYVAVAQSCVPRDNVGYNPGNYGGDSCDTDCPDCPDGALCDGEYVYCPAGSFVLSDNNGGASCESCCPDGDKNCRAMAWASYNSNLGDCRGVSGGMPYYEWAQGYPNTDCLWTDMSNTSRAYVGCYQFMGSDDTGEYEYRNEDDSWAECEYSE